MIPNPRRFAIVGPAARFLGLAFVVAATLAAGCPVNRDTVDEVPADARRARVGLEGTASLFDGALRVTFVEMERAGSFAEVTLALRGGSGGAALVDVTAVRQREYSEPIAYSPYVVAVAGFPGVDSVEIVAWRAGGE